MKKKIIIIISILIAIAILCFIWEYIKYGYQRSQTYSCIYTSDDSSNLCANAGDTYYYYENNDSSQGIYKIDADGVKSLIYESAEIYCIDADEDMVCFALEGSLIKMDASTYDIDSVDLDFTPCDIKIDSGNIFVTDYDTIYKFNAGTLEIEELLIDEDKATGAFHSSYLSYRYTDVSYENAYMYEDDEYYYVYTVRVYDDNTLAQTTTTEIDIINVFKKDTEEKIVGEAFDYLYNGKLVTIGGNYVDITDINTLETDDVSFDDSIVVCGINKMFDDKIIFSCQSPSSQHVYDMRDIEKSYIKILSLNDYTQTDILLNLEDIVVELKENYALIYKWKEQKYYSYDYETGEETFIKDDEMIKLDEDGSVYYAQSCGEKVFIYSEDYKLLDIIDN